MNFSWSKFGTLVIVGMIMVVGCGKKDQQLQVEENPTLVNSVTGSIEFFSGLDTSHHVTATDKNCFQWVKYTGGDRLEVSVGACPTTGVAARANVKAVLIITTGATNQWTVSGADTSKHFGQLGKIGSDVFLNGLCEASTTADAATYGAACSLTIADGAITAVNAK
jgi:hypothetical protein